MRRSPTWCGSCRPGLRPAWPGTCAALSAPSRLTASRRMAWVPEACSARRVNECSKDAGLHRISVRRVLGVPLDAEIPALVAVDGDGFDRPVRGVPGRPQPLTEHTQALMVIAGNGYPVTVDDLAQRRLCVQLDVVHETAVVPAGGRGHFLYQVSAA